MQVCVVDESLQDLRTTTGSPFGNPIYGVFDDNRTRLSYAGLGLSDTDFTSIFPIASFRKNHSVSTKYKILNLKS